MKLNRQNVYGLFGANRSAVFAANVQSAYCEAAALKVPVVIFMGAGHLAQVLAALPTALNAMVKTIQNA